MKVSELISDLQTLHDEFGDRDAMVELTDTDTLHVEQVWLCSRCEGRAVIETFVCISVKARIVRPYDDADPTTWPHP